MTYKQGKLLVGEALRVYLLVVYNLKFPLLGTITSRFL